MKLQKYVINYEAEVNNWLLWKAWTTVSNLYNSTINYIHWLLHKFTRKTFLSPFEFLL